MNKNKGLILKDLLELKAYKKNFIFSIFIYLFIIILNSDSTDMIAIGTGMIVFLFGVYAIATFSYDEKNNTDQYILTMGINKKDAITARYIFIILSMIVGIIVGVFISMVLSMAHITVIESFSDTFLSILGIIYSLSIIHGVQIPCIYKYGAEKGRLQIYLVAMIFFLIIGVTYLLFPNINFEFLNSIEFVIPYVLFFLIFLNYYISYKISYIIYLKKEL